MSKNKQSDQVKSLLVEEEILWHDRKRHLGMPLSFTVYDLDNNRLYVKRGLFNSVTDELLLYRVLDVKLRRTLGQKICRVGTITLNTVDSSSPILELVNVKNPDQTRRLLSNIVERERKENRIQGKEMYGASGMDIMDEAIMQGNEMDGDQS